MGSFSGVWKSRVRSWHDVVYFYCVLIPSGKSPFLIGKSTINGPFSIAMLEGILCGLHIGTFFRHADLNIRHASKKRIVLIIGKITFSSIYGEFSCCLWDCWKPQLSTSSGQIYYIYIYMLTMLWPFNMAKVNYLSIDDFPQWQHDGFHCRLPEYAIPHFSYQRNLNSVETKSNCLLI